MRPAILAATLALASGANIHRTGRTHEGRPTNTISQAVRYLSVQLGGKDGVKGDVQAKWDKDINLGRIPLHVTCQFEHPNANPLESSPLQSVTVSGSLLDVGFEAIRSRSDPSGSASLSLSYSLPEGTLLTANTRVDGDARTCSVERISAFRLAGPFNVQPSWFPTTGMFRFKLGRGGMRRRCPVSVQTEFKPGAGGPVSYEVGMRHQLSPKHKVRARLLLPSEAPRVLWCEYHDSQIDEEAVWIAKAAVELDGERGGIGAPILSLRRAWQW